MSISYFKMCCFIAGSSRNVQASKIKNVNILFCILLKKTTRIFL
jgi:hypothetical protein